VNLYFETSALCRYYHVEQGSDRITQLVADAALKRVVSWLTVVESHSAFAQKVRVGTIDASDFEAFRERLAADISAGCWKVARVLRHHYDESVRLIETYGRKRRLRSLDALHLGIFIGLRRRGDAEKIVTADAIIEELATAEGLPVLNPLVT